MSEYWLSHKKYFCKYCEIYITDDAPSRRQHESGLRHKGNRDRYVKNIYKQGERRKKDLEEERRELARVELAANAAFAQDVSAGHASLASSSSSLEASRTAQTASALKKPERPTSVWSNYTTAQSLGITDPDEERTKAEMERRRTQGLVGEWEVVAPPPPPLPEDLQDPKEEDTKDGVLSGLLPQKREAEASFVDEEDERRFKLRKRTISTGLGEIWDPGDIPLKLKSKKEGESTSRAAAADHSKETDDQSTAPLLSAGPRGSSQGSDVEKSESQTISRQASRNSSGDRPRWQPMRWKRATEAVGDQQTDTNEETDEQEKLNGADPSIKKDDDSIQLQRDALESQRAENEMSPAGLHVKTEGATLLEPSESTGGLFKKRKVPVAARGRRV